MYRRNKNGTSRQVSLRTTTASISYTVSRWCRLVSCVVMVSPVFLCDSSVPPVVKVFSAQAEREFPPRSPPEPDRHPPPPRLPAPPAPPVGSPAFVPS